MNISNNTLKTISESTLEELKEIESRLTETLEAVIEEQMHKLWSVGDRVLDLIQGPGVVIELEKVDGKYKYVKVKFPDCEVVHYTIEGTRYKTDTLPRLYNFKDPVIKPLLEKYNLLGPTHMVLDLMYTVEEGREAFSGSYNECVKFVQEEGSCMLYKIVDAGQEL